MALNFCVICDKPFSETKQNAGCVCPDCKEEADKELDKTAPLPLPPSSRFYRIR